MDTRERFVRIARFERGNDPFFWGVAAWNDTIRRWMCEGLPIESIDQSRARIMHLLGYENQKQGIKPNGAISAMGPNGNPPYSPAIDPKFRPEVPVTETPRSCFRSGSTAASTLIFHSR